jgi:hypothetical protein
MAPRPGVSCFTPKTPLKPETRLVRRSNWPGKQTRSWVLSLPVSVHAPCVPIPLEHCPQTPHDALTLLPASPMLALPTFKNQSSSSAPLTRGALFFPPACLACPRPATISDIAFKSADRLLTPESICTLADPRSTQFTTPHCVSPA